MLLKEGNYTHDCLEYFKAKAKNSKQKVRYFKEAAKYTCDIHKVFCSDGEECKTCNGNKQLEYLPEDNY